MLTVAHIIDHIKKNITTWMMKKKTGQITIEINFRNGGIANVYVSPKEQL